MRYGITALKTFPTGRFTIGLSIYTLIPTGGVIMPIIRLKTITMPKCTGFTPAAIKGGRRIGVSIMIAAVDSRNIPAIKRITFARIKRTIGLSEIPNIMAEAC